MKKRFTLLFAALLACLGAVKAQTTVTAVSDLNNTTGYTINSQERGYLYYDAEKPGFVSSTSHTNLTDDTPTGAENEQFAFLRTENTAEGEYYLYSIGAEQFVTYAETNGVKLALTDDPQCRWTLSQEGECFVIKVPNTTNVCINVTNWQAHQGCKVIGTGPDGGNKMEIASVATELSLTDALAAIAEYEDSYVEVVTISAPSEFENGKVYTFVTSRGWMGAKAGGDNAISTASDKSVTPDKNNTYFQWTVYKSGENYYLYNVGKGMFLGEQSTEANASVAMSATPAKVTFQATTKSGYPLMFKTTDNEGCVVNHSTSFGEGLITWNGGWSDKKDDGSCHIITLVGDLDNSVLTTIKNAVDAYEADNTEAKEALDAAIAKAEGKKAYLGEGMGKYTYKGEGDYATKVAEFITYSGAITEKNNPTPAAVEAKTAELNDLMALLTINLPEDGKYYRIMAVSGWNDDARYLGSKNSTAKDGRAEFVADADANTIFLFKDGYLKNYASGHYLVSNSNFLGYNGEQNEGSIIAFGAATNDLAGAYNISFNEGERWLYCHQSNYTDAGGSCGTQNGYCFNLEEVTELPVLSVTLDQATVTLIEGETLTLTATVAPDNATSKDVTWSTSDEAVATVVNGEVTAVAEGTATITATAGGKEATCVVTVSVDTTDIESIEAEAEVVIYDLSGRRVEKMEKGIYIVNGKKVIK